MHPTRDLAAGLKRSVDAQQLGDLNTKKAVARWAITTQRNIDLMVRDGRFPKPIYLGKHSPRWRRSDLIAWMEAKAGERNPA